MCRGNLRNVEVGKIRRRQPAFGVAYDQFTRFRDIGATRALHVNAVRPDVWAGQARRRGLAGCRQVALRGERRSDIWSRSGV